MLNLLNQLSTLEYDILFLRFFILRLLSYRFFTSFVWFFLFLLSYELFSDRFCFAIQLLVQTLPKLLHCLFVFKSSIFYLFIKFWIKIHSHLVFLMNKKVAKYSVSIGVHKHLVLLFSVIILSLRPQTFVLVDIIPNILNYFFLFYLLMQSFRVLFK